MCEICDRRIATTTEWEVTEPGTRADLCWGNCESIAVDWRSLAIDYRLVLDLIIKRNKLMNPEICLDMLDKAAKKALGK